MATSTRAAWLPAVASYALAGAALVQPPGTAEWRDWLLALVCPPLGARVAAHAPRRPVGWLISTAGLCAAGMVAASAGGPSWPAQWLWFPPFGLLVLVLLVFPDGSLHTWRAGVTAAATLGGTVALAHLAARAPAGFITDTVAVTPGWDTWVVLGAIGTLGGCALTAVAGLVVKVRRADPVRREPLILALISAVVLVSCLLADAVLAVPLVWLGIALAVPVATAVAVIRHGLYDIDRLLHRSLSYGLWTAAMIGAYAVIVALVAGLNPAAAPVVAAVTLAVLQPLRQWLDALVRRSLYGLGADPYRLTTALGRRVGLARTPEETLATAVEVIRDGLRAPWVAVLLGERDDAGATAGRRRDWPVTPVPLAHRGVVIGRLLAQQRSPDETWSRRERAVLEQLAAQLAPSAAALGLTRDLQAARESMVRAREDELRRLQRDLHDGVGPALSGARMLARAAAARPGAEPARPDLAEIERGLAGAAAEVRRVVDGLRPPALEHGLAAALVEVALRHRHGGPLIDLDLDDDLAELPAAVEVAVYRLIDEGLANVVKHASAELATVSVRRSGDDLCVTLTDDGVGGAASRAGGVGMRSMRARCEELGGTFTVEPSGPPERHGGPGSRPGGPLAGTRLVARLPLG